jgi:hypothetical protein
VPNRIRFGSDFDDKTSPKLNKLRQNFNDLAKGSGFKTLVQGVGIGAGVSAFNALGAAAGGAVRFMFDSVEAASNLSEQVNKSRVVFGDASTDVESFGDRSAKAFGISKRAALEAAGTFGNFFTGVGKGQREAAEMSTKLVKLAADLASFNNLDPTDVLDKLRAGLAGEAEPMRRLGVFLTEAKVKAKAMELGLADANGEISEGAKITARYNLILQETTTAQGDFTRTSESMANQQRTLNALAEDTSAKFGEVLQPAVIEFQRVIIRALDASSQGMDDMAAAAARGSQSAAAALAYARERGEASMTDMAGQVADRGDRIETAMDDVGTHASGMAADMGQAAREAADAFDKMVKDMRSDALSLVDDVFEETRIRDDLLANRMKENAAKRVLASKTATVAEKRDARTALHEVEESNTKLRIQLLAAGKLNKSETADLISDLEKKLRTSTGSTRQNIQRLINKVKELDRTRADVDIAIRMRTFMSTASKDDKVRRQHGGPVWPGQDFIVGEGPGDPGETLRINSDGTGFVTPNSPPSSWSQPQMAAQTEVPTVIQLVVDGRVLAEIVDAHLHRKVQRSPTSAVGT